MNKKTYRKSLICMLVAALVVTSFPSYGFAETATDATTADALEQDQSVTPAVSSDLPQGTILCELPEQRERSTKHFLLDNGTYEAVVYPSPVHYKKDGVWQDIDNTLLETDSLDKSSEKVYTNKSNEFYVELTKAADSKKTLTVSKDQYRLDWGLVDAQKSSITINPFDAAALDKQIISEITGKSDASKVTADSLTGQDAVAYKNEIIKTLTNLSSSVTYASVLPSVDLEYVVQSNEVKENLILQSPTDISNFQFNLNLKNLTPLLQKDGSIWFLDPENEKEPVFVMLAPTMYDAKGEISGSIAVDLMNTGSSYLVTVTPDAKWLGDENRAYPVTIDPPITTSLERTDIFDAHVSQGYPTTNYQNSIILKTGYGTGSQKNQSLIKFTLPELSSGSMITNATMSLYLVSSVSTPRQVDAHKITSAWSSSSVTWNTKPTYSTTIEDYQMVDNAASNYPWMFEITSVVKDWYSTGSNNGILLRNKDESTGYCEYLSSDCSDTYDYARPRLSLYYINNTGLEGYWTYHSQDLGRAGTGYVNDYNGNLIYTHTDVSMSGNLVPINVQHVFNSNSASSTSFGYGNGWRTSYDQKLLQTDIGGTSYYYLIDEDGTRHYFDWDETDDIYKDEDGLNLTLEIQPGVLSRYVVVDKENNKLVFNPDGYLFKVKDNNANETIISLNTENVINKVIDPSGREVDYNWSNGKLIGITDSDNRTTDYIYNSSSDLVEIDYPDGHTTKFTYDGNHNLLTAKSFGINQVSYTYTGGSVNRVASATLSASHGAETLNGESTTFSYGNNTTSFTDSEGNVTTYQFNDWGNTVNTKDSAGYASYTQYNETSGSASKNRTTLASRLQKTGVNYLSNHNMELGTDWAASNIGSSTGTGTFSVLEQYLGAKSYKLIKTNDTAGSTLSCLQSVNLSADTTYTLSGYVKTSGITSTTGGANLMVKYQDANGVWQTVTSEYVTGDTDWQRLYLTFEMPETPASTEVLIRGAITGATGTAYFDCMQLENGSVANRYNLVENGDFRGGSLTNWTPSSANVSTDDQILSLSYSPTSYVDPNVFKFVGDAQGHKYIKQTINISGTSSDAFILSGWAKGESVPLVSGTDRRFDLMVGFVPDSGDTVFVSVPFNTDASSWQYAANVVKSTKSFTSVVVYCRYYDNVNSAYFDGIRLFKEEFGQSYSYDSDGNLSSSKDINEKNASFDYNGTNDLIKATDPRGGIFEYTYDGNHNLTKAATDEAGNVNYTFEYSNLGNPTISKVEKKADASVYIKTTAAYTTSQNYMASITDPSGNTITNTWDEDRGTLSSVMDAKGKSTNYTYAPLTDQLTQTSKTVSGSTISVGYDYYNNDISSTGYLGDNIEKITHNDFSYVFGYNLLGDNTSVGITDGATTQSILTNEFADRTSLLLSTSYANGHDISYTYDSLNRVTSRSYQDNQRFIYRYDNSGNLGYFEDLVNGVDYRFLYDLSDRPIGVLDSLGNTLYNKFDENSNLSQIDDKINGTNYRTSFTYDGDNRQTAMTYTRESISRSITTEYDVLGRIITKAIDPDPNNTVLYETKYGYILGTGTSRTTQVGTVRNGPDDPLYYTYDANGNIATVTQGTSSIQYFYDELNQLIRENNQFQNYTKTYTYNQGGNLTEKRTYAYTTADPVTGTYTSVPYGYTDPVWKDKLTSYNGQSITYDAIGNPTSYNGKTYTWEEGRQLAGIDTNDSPTSLEISYKYNDQGIRTSKTVGSVTTDYHLVGDRVAYQTDGTNPIYFTYDSAGSLVSMKYGNAEYFYIRNLQGDIVGLIDTTGAKVVTYTYDAWGNVTNIGGEKKDTVGQQNPYRYRGYRLDSETGMYYLNSRYYVPEWGRFLNADSISALHAIPQDVIGKNLFTYCDNNPINRTDESGEFWWVGACALAGAVIGVGIQVAFNVMNGIPANQWAPTLLGAAAGGLAGGLVVGMGGGILAASYASAAAESIVSEVVAYTPLSGAKSIDNIDLGASITTVCTNTLVKGSVYFVTGKAFSKFIPLGKTCFKPQSWKSFFKKASGQNTMFQDFFQGTSSAMIYNVYQHSYATASNYQATFGGGGSGGHYAM